MIATEFRTVNGGPGKPLAQADLPAVPDKWEEIVIQGKRYRVVDRVWKLRGQTDLNGACPLSLVLKVAEVA